MIPGAPEIGAGLKVGSAVVRALNQKKAPPTWPNMHESLLALYATLEEWCVSAAAATDIVSIEISKRTGQRYETSHRPSHGLANFIPAIFAGYSGDIDRIMRPQPQLVERWSKAKRRDAARRGLRTVLAVYFPEFLVDFSNAVEARKEFVNENRDLQKRIVDVPLSKLEQIYNEAASTMAALCWVTENLGDLIVEQFPIDPTLSP